MNGSLAPCPLCGSEPICLYIKGAWQVVCDSGHEEFVATSVLSADIAREYWDENVEGYLSKGFAA